MNNPAVKTAQIKNTVFDLGAVLLDWNPEDIAEQFADSKQTKQLLLDNIFYHQDWKRLDLGAISANEAVQCFANNTGLPLPLMQELMAFIKNYLGAKEDSVALLQELHQKGHRLFCLSNICRELYDHVTERHPFFELFEGTIVSADVKLAKPDPKIFEYMLNRFDILAEETLFIDDMPANIESAKKQGIQGITFKEIDDCRRAIRHLIG